MTILKSSEPERSYRPDIDGLRALAILSVVLFHAGVPRITGGFTGVDIFFVISGYLIGGHIFSELHQGSFSYLRFYQRRAKRILPAFFLVISFTILMSLFLLSPFEAAELGRGAFAATLSASNILFWKTTGYFNTRSELNPLLMTWSLGVEEQFYALIPWLLVLLTRIRRNWVLPSILVCCAISFIFAVHELGARPTTVFYMLPARAWELGVGVALAVAELRGKRFAIPAPMAQIVSAIGLTLIMAPVFLLTVATPFPGAAALPSVLGTAILLAVSGSWVNQRFLSVATLVFIGRVSYSWYLWHWPLLSFTRVVYGGKLPPALAMGVVAAAFGAAVLSYFFVEQPFRKSSRAPAPLLLRYAAVSICVLAVCAVVWLSHGVPQRYPQLAQAEASVQRLGGDPCLVSYGKDEPNLSSACYNATAGEPAIALWGDSHSAALAPGFRSAAIERGYGFVQLGKASCPPLSGASPYLSEHPRLATECFRFNRKALDVLDGDPRIQIVILGGFWASLLHRSPQDGWRTADLVHQREVPALDASHTLFRQALTASIRSLQAAGKQVIVLGDVPVFEIDPLWRIRTIRIPARRYLARWLGVQDHIDPGVASPGDTSTAAQTTILLRQTLATLPGVQLVDLKPAFCNTPGQCAYRDGDRLLYADPQHLSANGAYYALRDFFFPALAAISK